MTSVLWTLLTVPRYHLLLVQNPPCLPVVLTAFLVSLWNGSRVCVDWHNLGFTMFLSDNDEVKEAVQSGASAPFSSRFASISRYVLLELLHV